MAERVGGWENDRPGEELTREQRNRVRTALQQFHLPKMAEYGFLEYDRESERVSLTPAAAETEFYVDSLSGREIPWGLYYLGLSILTVIGLFAVWGGLGPFAAVSITVYSVFAATVLAVSSLGHCYDTYYRMRLGAGEDPPRVDDR